MSIQYKYLKELISQKDIEKERQNKDLKDLVIQKELEFQEQNKNLKELILQNDIKIENLNKYINQITPTNDMNIQSGEYYGDFYTYDNNYKYMMYSNGERTVTKRIYFDKKYKKTPKVMVSFSLLDTEKDTNLRISVFPEHIDISGFDLTIYTWDNTKIFRVKAIWISYNYNN